MVRFKVDEQGVWTVVVHNSEHNHEFAAPTERHLLRLARLVSVAKGNVLKSMINAGIRTTDAYSYMAEEGGGAENLGFSKKDCYNYVQMQRKALIEVRDSQTLVHQFRHKANEDMMFYWDVQLDQDGRMTNFFWRDGRSRIDYESFGDVVIFDTTYRSNRYNLICTPFVGVNHHWQNVMFGCAFLSDETTSLFEWLFTTFLESMGNYAPKTIFTDQDQAMAKALEIVMPNTCHRLCLWHIFKNAPSYLGGLNNDRGIHHLFKKCLQECHFKEEFEETWDFMTFKYELQDHKWLNNLFKIRHKVCTTLNKYVFDCGIKASQRSESTNNVLNGVGDKCMSLTHFVTGFEKLVKGWRQKEAEEDYLCHQSVPPISIRGSTILKHASKVYKHKLYKIFERKYLQGTTVQRYREFECVDNLYTFELITKKNNLAPIVVHFDTSALQLTCTCKKFETLGILCSHALGVLHLKDINEIPKDYILRRWTINAKKRIQEYYQSGELVRNTNEGESVFRNHAVRYAYDLVTMSQGHEETRKCLLEGFGEVYKLIQENLKKLSLDSRSKLNDFEHNKTLVEDEEIHVLDPHSVKHKGISNSRFKGHFE